MRKSRLATAAVAAVLVGAFGFSVPAFAAGHGAVSVVEKDGKVTIGNDAISRTFSAAAGGKLETEEIFNKRANKKFDPSDTSEEFVVKLTKKNDAAGGLNTGDWTIVSRSSEETTGDEPHHGFAENFIDGDTNTYWHTKYTGGKDQYPHHVVIDLKKSTSFQCFSYTPRAQGAAVNGNVKGYKLYVSNAEEAPATDEGWGEPVAQGDFSYDGVNPIYVNLNQKATGRWVKFVAMTPNNDRTDGQAFAGGAKFNLFSSKHTAKP